MENMCWMEWAVLYFYGIKTSRGPSSCFTSFYHCLAVKEPTLPGALAPSIVLRYFNDFDFTSQSLVLGNSSSRWEKKVEERQGKLLWSMCVVITWSSLSGASQFHIILFFFQHR